MNAPAIPRFRSIEFANGALLLGLCLLAAAKAYFSGMPLRLSQPLPSAVCGALLMSLNISLLGRVLQRVLGGAGSSAIKAVLLVFLGLKTILLGLAVFLLFHYLALAPAAFVAGAVLVLLVPLVLALRQLLGNVKPLKID